MDKLLLFRVPIEGLHTETGPGVYEAAIQFSNALECADRGVLFKSGAKEIGASYGITPSFMAKWSAQYPGCSGHLHQSLTDGKKNLFFDAKGNSGMSKLFESFLAGQIAVLMGCADVLADSQQLQAAGRWLLGACQSRRGRSTIAPPAFVSFPARRRARGSRPVAPDRTSIPIWPSLRCLRQVCTASKNETHRSTDHGHQSGRRTHSACAALAEGNHRHLSP